MQTINFLTSHFIPENTACTNRVLAFVHELEKNYKVNVCCLSEKGIQPPANTVKMSENTTIYYIYQKGSNDKNFFLRAYYEIVHVNKLIHMAKRLPSDITIATTPYMFMIPLTAYRIKGKKILDIRDLVWEYIAEKNFFKKIIKKIFKFMMKHSIKKFDHLVVTNQHEKNLLNQKYITKEIDIIPNGITFERYQKISMLNDIISTDPFTITYLGNIGFAHNLLLLVKVAGRTPHFHYNIIGDGMELNDIISYAKEHNIENVNFTGKLEWSDIGQYYKNSSVLYAQLQERLPSAMPSKLFEYASTGLPIIYGGTGHAVSFVTQLENSIVIKPDNEEALYEAVNRMYEQNQKLSVSNRKLVEASYLREESAKILSKIVSDELKRKDED